MNRIDITQHPKTYQNQLTANGERIRLWAVTLNAPNLGMVTTFVLADTKENAVGQAQCCHAHSTYEVESWYAETMQAQASEVPLVIQGWGKSEF